MIGVTQDIIEQVRRMDSFYKMFVAAGIVMMWIVTIGLCGMLWLALVDGHWFGLTFVPPCVLLIGMFWYGIVNVFAESEKYNSERLKH